MPTEHPPQDPAAKLIRDEPAPAKVSRRTLVQGTGAIVAGSVVVGAAAGCANVFTGTTYPQTPAYVPASEFELAPPAPETPPDPEVLQFFTEAEAGILDALVATILPGDADDPGAREAGVVIYIDYLMASTPDGFAQPIYREGPFAQPYDGDQPPAGADTTEVVWVRNDALPRYGYQTILSPREIYRQGLADVERNAQMRFGQGMVDLDTGQQEEIVRAMATAEGQVGPGVVSEQGPEEDAAEGEGDTSEQGFAAPSLRQFFETVRTHIVQGMFADPAYGGNRDMAGWRLIGYPGAQRAYTPRQMRTPGIGLQRQPQTLSQLPAFNPGVRLPISGEADVVLPVSGSEPWSGQTGHDRVEGS